MPHWFGFWPTANGGHFPGQTHLKNLGGWFQATVDGHWLDVFLLYKDIRNLFDFRSLPKIFGFLSQQCTHCFVKIW